MQSKQTNMQLDVPVNYDGARDGRREGRKDSRRQSPGDDRPHNRTTRSAQQVSGDQARRSDKANATADHEPSKPWQRGLFRQVLKSIGDPAVVVRLWDGYRLEPATRAGSPVKPKGTVTITSPSVFSQIIRYREVGFGDAYSEGGLLIDGDMVDVLSEIESARQISQRQLKTKLFDSVAGISTRKPLKNTLDGSKSNISHHYNLGNEFYRLWLDTEAMQYTCAYYAKTSMTLEQAQLAKCEHVCRKLELKPGDTVVEAGCGWGGLARFMASHYGVRVKAFNISHEQVRFATERARELGLHERIEYIEDDYRNITGTFDKFVSIGMLEHVGKANFGQLGSVIDGCLREDGRGLIHTIGRNRPKLMNPWIEKRIFPGAYPPTLGEMMEIFQGPNFSVTDVENLRLHYAQTLEHWLARFDREKDRIRDMFDDKFVRAWRLYLTGSIAAFQTSSLQLFQVAFARGSDNTVSRNREHLYNSLDYPQTGVRESAGSANASNLHGR